MGIQGLIPFLEKVSSRIHLSELKGQCAAIDAYCWLHKGAYTCAEKLARGEKCEAYVYYCMKYVNMLLSHNIKPIMVFDGRYLPAKAGTEKKRRETREANRKTAAELLKAGRNDEARTYIRRSIDVTHAMALHLIKICRKNNIDCIVAPYEADAQLAYLNLQNIAQFVITEDSDLILFGCSKVVFKLDLQGYGLLVERDRLYLSMRTRPESFSFDNFRYMCILSGCDYLPSLPGIGLGKALKFINKTRDPDIHRALQRMPSYLNMTQLRVSEEYRDSFIRADATFRYQPVFDPRTRTVVSLTEPPDGEEVPQIVDEKLPLSVAFDLALGNLDPFTLSRVDNFNPDCPQEGILALQKRNWNPSISSSHCSIWSQNFGAFQPPVQDDKFPGTLNKMAILDVTPLRPLKCLNEVEEDILPSQADLLTMYGNGSLPRIEKHCQSPTKILSNNSNALNKNSESLSLSHSLTEHSDVPSPQVLNQRKLLNPFAKPKSAQTTNIGPVGVISHPNFFSALRKYDGYNPPKIDENKIVISRYFRTKEEICNKTFESACEIQKDDLSKALDTNNKDGMKEMKIEEDSVIAGYSNKENICTDDDLKRRSVLDTIEEIQLQEADNVLSEESLKKEDCVGANMNVNSKEEMTETDDLKRASAFDWSQFVSRKMQSSPKLLSSQAAHERYKNPFRKLVSTKRKNVSNRDDVLNFFKPSVKASTCKSNDISSQDIGYISPHDHNRSIDIAIQEHDYEPTQSTSEHSVFCEFSEHLQPNKKKVFNPLKKQFLSEIIDSRVQDLVPDEASLYIESLNKSDSALEIGSNQSISPIASTQNDTVSCLVDVENEKTFLKVTSEKAEEEIGPSENVFLEQLKQSPVDDKVEENIFRDSQDSGFSSLPETTILKSGILTSGGHVGSWKGKSQNTPVARRIGLGRSSAPSATSQKQNLLAQYGFSKKRKLMP